MIYKQILFSKIKSHFQNTLLFFTDNTGGDLVERGLLGAITFLSPQMPPIKATKKCFL
jgi:hypothetical protein